MNPFELKEKYESIFKNCLEQLVAAGYPVRELYKDNPSYVLSLLAGDQQNPKRPKLAIKNFDAWFDYHYDAATEMLNKIDDKWDKDWRAEDIYVCQGISCTECPFNYSNLPRGRNCDEYFDKKDRVEAKQVLQEYVALYATYKSIRRGIRLEPMVKENFRVINEQHAKTCQQILALGGRCNTIDCNACPFNMSNIISEDSAPNVCGGFADARASWDTDHILVESCEHFIKLYNKLVEEKEQNE